MEFLQISDGFLPEEAQWNPYRFLTVFLQIPQGSIMELPQISDGFPSDSSTKHNGIPKEF